MGWFDAFDIGDIISGVSAIGGIASDVLNYNQASNAQDLARQQIGQNAALTEASLAPRTDAYGNRYGYDPAKKEWFIELTDGTKKILSEQQAAQLFQLQNFNKEAPLDQAERAELRTQRGTERQAADGMLREFTTTQGPQLDQLQALFRKAAADEIGKQYDNTQTHVVNQALRSGTSAAPILAAMQKQRSADVGSARTKAEIDALSAFDTTSANRQSRLLGGYNTLATRGANVGNAAFSPTSPGVSVDQMATQAGSLGGGAGGSAAYIGAAAGPTFNFEGLGQSLGTLLKTPGVQGLFPTGKPTSGDATSSFLGSTYKDGGYF